MRQNHGFTLIEVLVSVALTGMILLAGYSAFQRIMLAQATLGAAIDVQKNLFYTNEKLTTLIREGGTIDYEEYFNRRMLGYARSMVDTSIDTETTNTDTYTFTNFSHFGNGNVAIKPPIYFCGVFGGTNGEACMTTTTTPNVLFDSSLYPDTPPSTGTYHFPATSMHQPYGQYAALAYNYLNPGFPLPIKLPPIITPSSVISIASRDTTGGIIMGDKSIINVGLPELYLIKKNLDNSYTRTYFRHVYVQDPFLGAAVCSNPAASLDGCLGKIQMTKLKDCDIGTQDGIIDAWIPLPEFAIGNVGCPGVNTEIYKSAHEELITGSSDVPANLTWVDITPPDMNVVRSTFLPNPLKIPTLMSGAGDLAQSPQVSVYLEVALSTKLRNKSFIRPTSNHPRILITTYDLSE